MALLYLLPVGLAAAFWGLAPGLTAAACAFLAFTFFFLPPYHTFHVLRPEDMLSLLVFLMVAVVISHLLGRAQASVSEARMRAREATHLHEMSMALVGATDPASVARILARQVQSTIATDQLRGIVHPGEVGTRLEIHLPVDGPPPQHRPDVTQAMQGMRSLMGDISLWRRGRALTPSMKRMVALTGVEWFSLKMQEYRYSLLAAIARFFELII